MVTTWLTYQREGFPLTGYFIPGRVGIGVWPGSKIVVVVVRARVQVQASGPGTGHSAHATAA